jgi:hypothetical protein
VRVTKRGEVVARPKALSAHVLRQRSIKGSLPKAKHAHSAAQAITAAQRTVSPYQFQSVPGTEPEHAEPRGTRLT